MEKDNKMSSEIKEIMMCLGRRELDGEVRGSHLSKVLMYLSMQKEENLDITLSKLALVLGMNPRYVRENYLKGLMYFGVIKIYELNHNTIWKWIGINAFNNGSGNLSAIKEITQEIRKAKEPEKKYESKNKCLNCGKEVINKTYCNEDCVREYYLSKRNSE